MPRERKIVPIIISAAIFILMEVAAMNMLSRNGALQEIWIARGAHNFMRAVWGGSESVKYYFSLKKQNEALAEENFALRQSLLQYGDEASRARLDTMTLGLGRQVSGFTYIPATIAKMSRNSQHNYLIINKGSEEGVTSHSGIVTGKGVVGIIDAVGRHHAYALTFMNSDISISARLGTEGAVGPLVWDGKSTGQGILKEIPLQYKYSPGDTVYTSGYSSIFPPDIPLGTAGESKVINGATNEIKIKLFQDFTALRFVMVVSNSNRKEMEDLSK